MDEMQLGTIIHATKNEKARMKPGSHGLSKLRVMAFPACENLGPRRASSAVPPSTVQRCFFVAHGR